MISVKQLLKNNSHRPFPLPPKKWFIYQQWSDTLFVHYRLQPEIVTPLIPPPLQLDTLSGHAWISMVVFSVTDLRSRFLPFLPILPAFNEFNLRTYVQYENKPGIYFLEIKANQRKAVLLNKALTKLPYQFGDLKKDPPYHYSLAGKSESNMFDITFQPGNFLTATAQDRWLTERYCCYQDDGPELYRYNIHHPQWPLYGIDWNCKLLRLNSPVWKLEDLGVPVIHYSPLQPALIWRRDRII